MSSAEPRPFVLQCEDLDEAPAAWLRERCDVAQVRVGEPAFQDSIGRAQGLVVRTYTRVDERLLALAPNLRVVGRAGVGLDNIDLPACRRRGVTVVHTPAANTQAVAEYVFAMLHDVLRPRTTLDAALDGEQWLQVRRGLRARRQFSQLTLGIWGMGRIGRAVARIAGAYGMRVLYNDLIEIPPDARAGASPADLWPMLRDSDVVTLHVDDRPSNARIVDAAALAQVRDDAVLVNASRGFVVDTAALATFLRDHPAAWALLDVHDPEPFGPGYPLLGLPNAHLSPHIAAATALAQENMSWVVRDLWRALRREPPEHAAI